MQLCYMNKLLFIPKFMHHQKVNHHIKLNMKMSQKCENVIVKYEILLFLHRLEFSLNLNILNLTEVGEHVPYRVNSILTKAT